MPSKATKIFSLIFLNDYIIDVVMRNACWLLIFTLSCCPGKKNFGTGSSLLYHRLALSLLYIYIPKFQFSADILCLRYRGNPPPMYLPHPWSIFYASTTIIFPLQLRVTWRLVRPKSSPPSTGTFFTTLPRGILRDFFKMVPRCSQSAYTPLSATMVGK